MAVEPNGTAPLLNEGNIVGARQVVRHLTQQLKFSLVDQTKMITAASELARNTLDYAGGGNVDIEIINGPRRGVRLTFEDHGPGIKDIDAAMRDGFTTGNGLGLGLGGAKRLCSEFSIHSVPGEGTRVTCSRWK